MNLKFFIIFLTSLLTLTACVSNSSVRAPVQNSINITDESDTETIPEVKAPDGKKLLFFQRQVIYPVRM
ncbi:hypothetical protein [Paenibacillus qinlingensis]|uniref:hypothetical protein n=1 Tax=Paenibacillus qinlingensis TaxID=1837343 RepID=UPI001564B626|nr:hypothetical protein [Paenibacillus qinlingensis]NQX60600.1 hypothetical protein [Paenibacillus qinlingensis]